MTLCHTKLPLLELKNNFFLLSSGAKVRILGGSEVVNSDKIGGKTRF